VRDGQFRLLNPKVIIEQDVNIDNAVVIDSGHTFLRAPHQVLNVLSSIEELTRTERSIDYETGIEETMLGMESPRLSVDSRGTAFHLAHFLTDKTYSLTEVCTAVTQIGAEPEAGSVQRTGRA